MKSSSVIPFISIALITSLLHTSCRKNDREKDTDITLAMDNALAENVFAGIFKVIGEYTDSSALIRSGCATYMVDSVGTSSWPKTLTIDFGTTNCLGSDANYRRGKIIASFTGRYRDSTTIISVTLDNYYHNNNKVEVNTHTLTNNGHNASGNLTYTINVQNALITTAKGTITWNSQRTREWILGESTNFNPFDDVYLIRGSANGTGVNGNSYSLKITIPLRVALNCAYIQSGSYTLTPQNLSSRIFDFGNGVCDDKATVSVNGVVYTITL